jgi:hypothetical protein
MIRHEERRTKEVESGKEERDRKKAQKSRGQRVKLRWRVQED